MKKISRYMTGIWARGERDHQLVIIRAVDEDGVMARVSLPDGWGWEDHEHVVAWSDIHEVA